MGPRSSKTREAIWTCKCECGETVNVIGSRLTGGFTYSCGCIKSKGEETIGKILRSEKIDYKREESFHDLRDERPLLFDFFIPSLNCAIEYQGVQHYKAVKYFGGEEAYQKRKKHDLMKKQYCAKNGINLIEVTHTADTESKIRLILERAGIIPQTNIL